MTAGPSPRAGSGDAAAIAPGWLSVAWQAAGSAATLGAAAWVSWSLGLAAQGTFGFAKSWFDAAAPIAALGLPQGLLHLQYRLGVRAAVLRPWLRRAGLWLTLACLAAAIVMGWLQQRLAAAVLLSLPFAVGHLVARSVVLAARGVVWFGMLTALPALLVLAGAVGYGVFGVDSGFELLLWTAAALAGTVSMTIAWRSAGPLADAARDWPRAALWQASAQSWIQAAGGALLAAALLSTVASMGHGGAQLGAASLGLHVYQVFAVIAGYLAPLQYDRLAREDRPAALAWPAAARRAGVAIALTAPFGVAASWVEPRWAWWLLPASLMLPAGVAAVAARGACTLLLARGAYAELSAQALWRLLLAVSVCALALRWLPAAAAVALALLCIESATWWRAAALVKGQR